MSESSSSETPESLKRRPTRVLVCEDDDRFRGLLVRRLEARGGFEVTQAATGERACGIAQQREIDLALLDLELPGISGVEVVERMRRDGPGPEVIILTSFRDETRLFEAMRAGAAGYLVKGVAPQRLFAAIAEVLRGGVIIDSRLARRFWNHFASVRGRQEADFGLTKGELEVLQLVARGLSNPEAAQAMGGSARHVKTRLESVYRKLGVSSRVEAAVKALKAGLIDL